MLFDQGLIGICARAYTCVDNVKRKNRTNYVLRKNKTKEEEEEEKDESERALCAGCQHVCARVSPFGIL
jgi:hypothetical protein